MEPSAESKTSKANTSFCLNLLKKLGEIDKTANVFYSPFSISSALAMVMMGTKGNTHIQISEVLRFSEVEQPKETEEQEVGKPSAMQSQLQTRKKMNMQIQQTTRLPPYLLKVGKCFFQCMKPQDGQDCQGDVHANFSQLLSQLTKEDAPFALSLANRLYGEQSYQFVEDFLEKTRKYYKAELESVDFKNSFEAARLNINNWVQEKTQDKIKDVLAQGVVDNMTRLVLVNAIYFKGHWNKQFQESDTHETKFRVSKTETKPVKIMHQRNQFRCKSIPEVSCQILELPYKGKELSMLIFLPMDIEDDSTGLEKLEKEMTYENFVEWTRPDKMEEEEEEVQVGLPRFTMEEKYDLKDVLVSMGMVDAFNMKMSDFSGMSPANDLVLSKVIHKSYVEVNEEGTEAAAATAAITVERTSLPKAIFLADHPFLFFIRHNPSKSLLFAGRYCSPE